MEPSVIGMADEPSNETKEINDWIPFGMRLAVNSALHPFEYAKVLIQLGYEPIAARPGKSLLGRPIMVLPNIFQYAAYIRKTDGFYGCYRGLAPKIVGAVLSTLLSEKIANRVGLPAIDNKDTEGMDFNEYALYMQFRVNLKHDVVISATSIIVSHPFHVISVRMMAQFIGRESIYSSICGSVAEIYRTEGILGFFAGLSSKLLCDLACLVLTSSSVYLVSKYWIKDHIGRQYLSGFSQFLLANILYPLHVVSTCMIVSGTRLMAGRPPCMPIYRNSFHCWNDLQARGELKRGSALFRRSLNVAKPRLNDIALPSLERKQ